MTDPATPPTATLDVGAPDVSVIIPAWNVARFVGRAIASALAQEGVSVEVVVADDASTDDTAATVERLAAADPRIRLLRATRNGGAGAARNRALAAARGRWMAMLDADDAFAPGRLALLVGRAEAEALDVVADLPRLWDLTAAVAAPFQYPARGGLGLLGARDFALSSADPARGPAPGLDLGLLKPVCARRLVESGTWRYPEGVRHGEDFLAAFHALRRGARFGLLHEAHYIFSTRIGQVSRAWSQGSVTPVNYRVVMTDTEALIALLEREGPPPGLDLAEATALLRGRIDRHVQLNRDYGWTTLWEGAWRRHLAWLRRDPRNIGLMAGEAGRRLLRGRWLLRRLGVHRAGGA